MLQMTEPTLRERIIANAIVRGLGMIVAGIKEAYEIAPSRAERRAEQFAVDGVKTLGENGVPAGFDITPKQFDSAVSKYREAKQ